MSNKAADDSVPLVALAGPPPKTEDAPPRQIAYNFKLLLSLFLTFMLVVSDVFTSSVLSGFGEKAVVGRIPTVWGIVLQGIFLVIGYAIAVYLIKHNIL
jgi:hypothetical protein